MAPFVPFAFFGNPISTKTTVLNDPVLTASHRFGFSASISGDGVKCVVGCPGETVGGATNAGKAYVFNTSTGALLQTLQDPAPLASENLGYDPKSLSLSEDGSRCAVGISWRNSSTGIVYIFNTSTGGVIATLNDPSPLAGDRFGYCVSLSSDGTVCAVGCPYKDLGGTFIGVTYIFNASTGALIRTVNNPTPLNNEYFGFSVSLSGAASFLAIGAFRAISGGNAYGQAYTFNASTGALVATLNDPNPLFNGGFGHGVSLSDDGAICAVGAVPYISNIGAVHIFNASTGALIRTLVQPSPTAGDYFGVAVSLSSDGAKCLVGCNGKTVGAVTDAGAAYKFDTSTGNLLSTLENPYPTSGDDFSQVVELSSDGTKCVVGAPYEDPAGISNAGQAYAFAYF